MMKQLVFSLFFITLSVFTASAESVNAVYITGGCCHDYAKQQVIIPEGLGERMDIKMHIIHEEKAAGLKKQLSNPKWHEGFDLVIYNFCQAGEKDNVFVDSVTKVHYDGKPAIAIHCAMHSFHWHIKEDKKTWTKMVGVSSRGHGPKTPIDVTVKSPKHEIMKGLPEKWTTPKGELYNVQKVHEDSTILMVGKMTKKGHKKEMPTAWVNTYGKGHIFATTLGHHNETIQDKPYMDMLANAVVYLMKKSNKTVVTKSK